MKAITKFSAHKTALTFSLVMAVSSLIFLIPMSLVFLNAPMNDQNGNPVDATMPLGFILAMPFLYLVMGYIMTIVGAWIYNLVAKFTVGIQFELSDNS